MAEVQPLPLPLEEAIEYWRAKVPVPKEVFYRLADEARAFAFTVADAATLDAVYDVWELLDRALAEGLTLADFARLLDELPRRKGWEGPTPHRVDTIFRTNIQTAYSVGRYRQMTDPDVLAARPYWEYDAVNDQRTRPSHLDMDGRVWRADDPIWNTWYPPNGFRCRCSVRSVSEREVRARGLQVETGPAPGMPDPGFDHNPAKIPWQPDLSRYPPALRAEYEKRRQARASRPPGP